MYNVRINFVTYFGIINCIKNVYNHTIEQVYNHPYIIYYPLPVKILNYFTIGCTDFYNFLTKDNNYDCSAGTRWNNDLDMTVDVINWSIINLRPFITTNDTKLQWFQYRITNHILGCNYLLHKMYPANSDLCSFCHIEVETIQHLL